jgi:hypothetical protein
MASHTWKGISGGDWTTANAAIVNSGLIQLGGGTLKSIGSSASVTAAAFACGAGSLFTERGRPNTFLVQRF